MITRGQVFKLWESVDQYLNGWNKIYPDVKETTTYLFFETVLHERNLLDIQEFSSLNKKEEEELDAARTMIPIYLRSCALFKKMAPNKIEKILDILDTPSLDKKRIIALRKDVIRKEKERVVAKKNLVKDGIKQIKKTKTEESWDL